MWAGSLDTLSCPLSVGCPHAWSALREDAAVAGVLVPPLVRFPCLCPPSGTRQPCDVLVPCLVGVGPRWHGRAAGGGFYRGRTVWTVDLRCVLVTRESDLQSSWGAGEGGVWRENAKHGTAFSASIVNTPL